MEGLVEKLCNRFNGVTGIARIVSAHSGFFYFTCCLIANLQFMILIILNDDYVKL